MTVVFRAMKLAANVAEITPISKSVTLVVSFIPVLPICIANDRLNKIFQLDGAMLVTHLRSNTASFEFLILIKLLNSDHAFGSIA